MQSSCQINFSYVLVLVNGSCIHPDCFKFKALCEVCLGSHENKHSNNQFYTGNQWIITTEECQSQVQKILQTLREELELAENKAANALITTVNSNIDEIILEIESIRQQIQKLFDKYIQGLRDKFEYKVKQNIHSAYDNIQEQLRIVKQFLNDRGQLKVQRMVMQTDLDYQVQYEKNRLESLIYQRANQKFNGRIDDDVALHFIGVIQKELEQLVIYDKNKLSTQIETMNHINHFAQTASAKSIKNFQKFISYAPEKIDEIRATLCPVSLDHSFYKSWLHYFEPGTKFLYYIDLKQVNPQITKTELEIDFTITQGSRSILASDGYIYYLSGFDDNKNEEENKTIYQYDHIAQSLTKKARMYTLRKNYSLVSTIDKEIYIIGGQNYKEGCLSKCEKYNINTNSITIINHLKELSTLHSSCVYNNKLILKYGGFRVFIENDNLRNPCQQLLEVYSIEQDFWTHVEFQQNPAQFPPHTILSTSVQIPNTNKIYIFGGQIENKKIMENTNQGFMISIEEEEEYDQADQIKFQPKFSYQLQCPIPGLAYFVSQPTVFDNKIIALMKEKEVKKYIFEKNKWKVI